METRQSLALGRLRFQRASEGVLEDVAHVTGTRRDRAKGIDARAAVRRCARR
jgi:hypothetical protein